MRLSHLCIFTIFMVVFTSCGSEQQPEKGKTVQKTETHLHDSDADSIARANAPESHREFAELLEEFQIDTLPQLYAEHLFFMDSSPGEEERDAARSVGYELDVEFAKSFVKDTFILRLLKEGSNSYLFSLIHRLPPLDEHVEMLVFNYGGAFFMASFDKTRCEFIDDCLIALNGDNYEQWDLYYSTGFCINKDYTTFNLMHVGYEEYYTSLGEKVTVSETGKFKTKKIFVYHDEKNKPEDYDYHSRYYLLNQPKPRAVSAGERTTRFNAFVDRIPAVKLPYNSAVLKSYHTNCGDNPSSDIVSVICHQKLKPVKDVALFFSNDPNEIALKTTIVKTKNGGFHRRITQGPHFYPIARFKAGKNTAILFIYESTYHFQPALYCRLNLYNQSGIILATKILARDNELYDGGQASKIVIKRDLSIQIETTSKSYDYISSYPIIEDGDTTYSVETLAEPIVTSEIEKKTYRIQSNGSIK